MSKIKSGSASKALVAFGAFILVAKVAFWTFVGWAALKLGTAAYAFLVANS